MSLYAELHSKTNFSFLEGASHADELVQRAVELGYRAIAVTDRNSLAGVVRAHAAAKDRKFKLLVGAEITPEDASPVVLLATDRAAYGRLARLITRGRRQAEKGQCRLMLDDIAEHAAGLLAGVVLQAGDAFLGRYREIFGDRCYALAELHRGPDDARQLDGWIHRARRARVPLVAAGDVHYHDPSRRPLHDVLTATRAGVTVAEAGELLFPNAQRHLKSIEEIVAAFARAPDAVRRSVEVAERCAFSLDELRYEYPEELAPPGESPLEYLARLTWAGANERYPAGTPDKVRRLLEHELALIGELRYEAYFLTVWDLVRFARQRGILCQGRGSAANSAVCYALGVTAVDPERMDVLFERFVSRERNEAPDIDVDFEHERREEVLQYLYEKYGRERAGMTAEVITYRPRSAVRDVGKALGFPLEQVDALAKKLEGHHHEPDLPQRCREAGIDPEAPAGRQLLGLVDELIGFPRHLSQHTGGMVMTRTLLCELVPIENAAMPGRTVIQWDKNDLDELGILKVDCLALGMLTAIRKCFEFVQRHYGRSLTMANIPEGDADVYRMIRRADTVGVFQIESRAQMSMLPRLRPRSFYDLVIEVAIVRPGPIQGNMVHPYLRRRAGLETVKYPNEAIRSVLDKTLGVPLFQEQAMRLAVVAAGFTPGEADQLRRAMGAWRRPGLIDEFRKKLISGMLAKGLSETFAEQVFQQIRGFGDYGFPESHAASFALLVYVSAWLKHHYPAAFTAALLNSQPMGFYAPPQLIRDAREHGIEVRLADVNASDWDCTLERGSSRADPEKSGSAGASPSRNALSSQDKPVMAIRLGLRMLSGLASSHAETIWKARQGRPFASLEDLARRTGLGRAALARLAKADALGSFGLDRRGALWHTLAYDKKELPLFAEQESNGQRPEELPAMTPREEVWADYRTTGLSLKAHPMSFLREWLSRGRGSANRGQGSGVRGQGIEVGNEDRLPTAHRPPPTAHSFPPVATAEQLKTMRHGSLVRVAGLVLVRQRPGTARGITFVTLEDETGIANLIIRPQVWQRYRQAARGAAALLATGRLQRAGEVIHVLVSHLEDLSSRLTDASFHSRDFC